MAHIIREISIKDTEALTTLLTKIYDESDYTLYNPGEFNPSVSSISNVYSSLLKNTNVHNTKQSLHLVLLNFIKKKVLDLL